MKTAGKKIELADHAETESRAREIQLLINLVEPDPQYQPAILTDEANLLDAVGTETMTRRLKTYFGVDFDLSLRLPLWKLVDAIKARHPRWPDSLA